MRPLDRLRLLAAAVVPLVVIAGSATGPIPRYPERAPSLSFTYGPADGRSVDASPGHPLAVGRRVGDLRAGDPVHGSLVISAELVPYAGRTWDLLPAGPTDVYRAEGVPLRSTLSRD